MAISLATRAARALAAASLAFCLGLAPSYARMGGPPGAPPPVRPGLGVGHFQHAAPRGFDRRFAFSRPGFHRFSPNRFDRFGFDRFGSNRFGGNQLFVGGWGWGCCGWGGVPASTGASEPIIVGGAPVIINVGADPKPGDAGGGSAGGCVTHKLLYDSDGKYVGERQTSQC